MDSEEWKMKDALMREFNQEKSETGVSGKRLAERLDILSMIGRTSDNGSKRPGFSLLEREAKTTVIKWMKEASLSVRQDGAGNIIGRLEGEQSSLPAIMSGSHVDTVSNGGHFDGTLGVLSALEVAQAWKDTGYLPKKPFEVVIFTDEEGSRFNGGLTGSEALTGDSNIDDLLSKVDNERRTFKEVIADVGLTVEGFEQAKRDLNEIETYVEIHIEQGKRLEKEDLPCGIVNGIAGPYWMKVTFKGLAGHAGNTPMDDRRDALVAASEFIQKVSELPRTINMTSVATVGNIEVKPNGTNVIPGEVILYVDIRDIKTDSRQELISKIISCGENISHHSDVSFEHKRVHNSLPVPIPSALQDKLAEAAKEEGIRPYFLPSGAGHDAMILGRYIPVALLFVRSRDGISHNPAEWSDLSDCVQTVQVLKRYIEKLQ
ncbi:M20 family metallo-hydrolase [Alkalibacterium sp. 20]|uniref:M20 family metallo-hydrolase n=1 Tax=Alkalibacterium sp. 20 TaxID=1798803 RepID=UPI0009003C28|nr:M20 family metallo-hydrolase [Alkalibacterium sp. 20]OJF93030.1 allantoate amidohydrolase [Alkalibacterium sp. 20]